MERGTVDVALFVLFIVEKKRMAREKNAITIAGLVVIVLITSGGSCLAACRVPVAQTQSISTFTQIVPTKTSGCVAHDGLPDLACTPGAIFANVTAEMVCVKGYSRAARNVSTATKEMVYAAYGITRHQKGEYEVDHQIPLELGGSNDVANLWPEAANPTPGFHQKDTIENDLHDQVCSGQMTLAEAQNQINVDWRRVYETKNGGEYLYQWILERL